MESSGVMPLDDRHYRVTGDLTIRAVTRAPVTPDEAWLPVPGGCGVARRGPPGRPCPLSAFVTFGARARGSPLRKGACYSAC